MAAPLIGFLFAFLMGAALPVATADATFGSAERALIAVNAKAATDYARLPAICAATDPALDRLSDAADVARAKSRWRAIVAAAADRLARDADIACNAAREPNTVAGRLKAAVDALSDIAKADRLAPPANPNH
jgi:hypothetical protein